MTPRLVIPASAGHATAHPRSITEARRLARAMTLASQQVHTIYSVSGNDWTALESYKARLPMRGLGVARVYRVLP